MNHPIQSYRELIVWQRATQLTIAIYQLTEYFPKKEQFGLTSQMRRAAISVASNIAEGRHRGSRKDFVHFLRISYASGAELETQCYIAQRLPNIQECNFKEVESLLQEVMKMLNTMIQKLKA